MVPEQIELYAASDEVELTVHRDEDGFLMYFWLSSGIASISYRPEQFMDLLDLLSAYKEEEIDPPKTPNYMKLSATIFLITLVGAILFMLISS